MRFFKVLIYLLLLLIVLICSDSSLEAANPFDVKFIKFFNPIVENLLQVITLQKPANENGTRGEFKEYLLEDNSNENIGLATPQEILTRSGYRYENHYVISDDGYITLIIRIINPLVEPKHLKQPPVMLVHGGVTDQTSWIWASAIQHHPEKYPRTFEEDGPITSWNRSLAFVLANNGYDVWLIGMRGGNEQSQGHKEYKINELSLRSQFERLKYWQYTMDDIVEFELPRQIDKVLEVTGAQQVNLIGISMSSQTTLSMLVSNEQYAAKVHNYVAMSAPITSRGTAPLNHAIFKTLCSHLPDELGTIVFTDVITSAITRKALVTLNSLKKLRYTIIWAFMSFLFGPSPLYQTNLEPAVVGHVLQPTGFKMAKHYCQQVNAGRLQKFNHGPKKNLKLYGKLKPPVYNLTRIPVKNWAIVYGNNDVLATPHSHQILLDNSVPKPRRIFGPNYNHVESIAAMTNAKYVNLPILKFLDEFRLPPL